MSWQPNRDGKMTLQQQIIQWITEHIERGLGGRNKATDTKTASDAVWDKP